ncbi:unknown [Fusobacterium nucleatum subsp. nucleatum ATCC 25586]|uniref:Uncharacterized protein n=1 Tax=Fusobacterium nucleatum subsp. nucleatum (strain ATCC 25586 / DSM 15643 / BCRC 10681 / CIP 101130 / JCM 8532 / KCTC 2640 / LMG 13131 / VPI 4355) TaxID=190304 RepID=Q8RIK2_FUSNN|nr:unknown [Fusobacterium nucleatum subsp. nucleatum ATCC 25586]
MYIFSSTIFMPLMYHIKNTMSRKFFYFFNISLNLLVLLTFYVFYFLYKIKILI